MSKGENCDGYCNTIKNFTVPEDGMPTQNTTPPENTDRPWTKHPTGNTDPPMDRIPPPENADPLVDEIPPPEIPTRQ